MGGQGELVAHAHHPGLGVDRDAAARRPATAMEQQEYRKSRKQMQL
jgi:hypothetical protein